MQQGVFYLHEDEWAMLDLLPAENFEELLNTARSAQAFAEEHFDGFGWTDMYVIPEPTHSFSLRALPFNELQDMLRERFHQADIVQSGYSSYREEFPNSFAFVDKEDTDGAFYGNQENGLVTSLHLLPCNKEHFVDILYTLGVKYNLVLADWWGKKIIDLRERNNIVKYLQVS